MIARCTSFHTGSPAPVTGGSQLFERPRGGERAILVGVGIGHPVDPYDTSEFKALAASAGTVGRRAWCWPPGRGRIQNTS